MLISEIEPINKIGVNLLEDGKAEDIIDKIIEKPLRKACKIFREKGIQTLMSSANRNNILKEGELPKEKEELYEKIKYSMVLPPNFDEAGRGYVWIMINFDTLSDENKDWLFSLEEKVNSNGEKIGEKAIWFVHPCEIGNIEYNLKIGKLDYEMLKQCIPEEQLPPKVEIDPRLVEFEKRHIVLGYNWSLYDTTQSVFLRKPINKDSTVEEVEEYFSKLAQSFRNQEKAKILENVREHEEK